MSEDGVLGRNVAGVLDHARLHGKPVTDGMLVKAATAGEVLGAVMVALGSGIRGEFTRPFVHRHVWAEARRDLSEWADEAP